MVSIHQVVSEVLSQWFAFRLLKEKKKLFRKLWFNIQLRPAFPWTHSEFVLGQLCSERWKKKVGTSASAAVGTLTLCLREMIGLLLFSLEFYISIVVLTPLELRSDATDVNQTRIRSCYLNLFIDSYRSISWKVYFMYFPCRSAWIMLCISQVHQCKNFSVALFSTPSKPGIEVIPQTAS